MMVLRERVSVLTVVSYFHSKCFCLAFGTCHLALLHAGGLNTSSQLLSHPLITKLHTFLLFLLLIAISFLQLPEQPAYLQSPALTPTRIPKLSAT